MEVTVDKSGGWVSLIRLAKPPALYSPCGGISVGVTPGGWDEAQAAFGL
jgi:hypothetical protein